MDGDRSDGGLVLKRVVLGLVGALLVLVAGVAGAFAAWGYLTFANGGSLRYDLGTVVPGPDETAIVIDVDRFGASIPYLDALGVTQLAVRSVQPGGADTVVFVGADATTDVDAYVKGVPYAVALRDANGWQVRQIPGSAALPAADSGTWLAQTTATTALLDVPTSRPLTIVIARQDGTAVGAVSLAADFAVPTAQKWAMWLGIGAAVALLVGIVLLVLAFRRRRPRGAHEALPATVVVTEPDADVAAPERADEPATALVPIVAAEAADSTGSAAESAAEPAPEPDALPTAPPPHTAPAAAPALDETAEIPVVAAVDHAEPEPDEHQPT